VTSGKPPAPSTAPSTAALAVKLALGVALVLYAWRRWRQMGAPAQAADLDGATGRGVTVDRRRAAALRIPQRQEESHDSARA
jgi:hypothetical protein